MGVCFLMKKFAALLSARLALHLIFGAHLCLSSAWAAVPVDTSTGDPESFVKTTLTLDDDATMNYYLRTGSGPTLVLIPGTWGGFWRFESLIAALPETMSVAVLELRWQAGNVPPSLDMRMEQLADDTLRAVEVMKLDRFVIAGHSIGGMIAVEIAGRDVPGLVGAIPMEGWTHHTVVKTAFEGVVVSNLTPEEEAWRAADRVRGRKHLSDDQLGAIGRIWKDWNGYAALERAAIPVLEIWGDRSAPRPDRVALQIPDRANIEIGWIPEASHLVLMEDPAAVARLVMAFMAKF